MSVPREPRPGYGHFRPTETHALLQVRGVSRTYDMGEVKVPVLSGVDFDVHPGEFVILYGPSGSGKTTLLNMLAGIDRPDTGHVTVRGHDLARLDDRGLTAYRRSFMGYVFQFYNLVPTLTAEENVALALELAGRDDHGAVQRALAAVGLAGKADRFPSQLSGGEQQRVAIARAVVKGPHLLAADEPTGNLDASTSAQVLGLLQELNRRDRLTIVLATHNPSFARAADRVLEIADGRLHERRP